MFPIFRMQFASLNDLCMALRSNVKKLDVRVNISGCASYGAVSRESVTEVKVLHFTCLSIRCDCEEGGQTPLHFAAAAGKVSVVKLLLRWQDVCGEQPGYGRLTEWRDQLGRTPIELAKGNGHQEVVKLLERYIPDCEAA